jgi:hypothetical protein
MLLPTDVIRFLQQATILVKCKQLPMQLSTAMLRLDAEHSTFVAHLKRPAKGVLLRFSRGPFHRRLLQIHFFVHIN